MKKYYAVVKGVKPGIYITWSECKKQVHGFSGAVFKRFKNKSDAESYLKSKGKAIKRKRGIESIEKLPDPKKRKIHEDNVINIFTDGACSGNGTEDACAGIGVYFGPNECFYGHRSLSRRLPKDSKQTNNTAELSAIIEALKIILDNKEDVIIHSDSEYCIKGIKGINKIKKNKELFHEISALLKYRGCYKTTFVKVLAHTGVKDGNYYADKLASEAINANITPV